MRWPRAIRTSPRPRSSPLRKVKGEENTYLLAWTTTPWTLPSNVALCVNPEETYCYAVGGNGALHHGRGPGAQVLGEEREITRRSRAGSSGAWNTSRSTPFGLSPRQAHGVVADDYVTLTDGTGMVHIAPAFGEDDARVGRSTTCPLCRWSTPGQVRARGRPGGRHVRQDADPVIIAT